MKAYRMVIYVCAPYQMGFERPAVTIMRIDDLTVPIEEATTNQPGVFMVHDVFDYPDGPLDNAIALGMMRTEERQRREDDMATLYHYTGDLLRAMKDSGVVGSRPAPLSADEIATVLKQLADHPDYDHQTLVVPSGEEGVIVEMKDGIVKKVAA